MDSLLSRNEDDIFVYAEQIQGQVNTFLYHNRMIYSYSAEAKFLKTLDDKIAAHAASALLGNQPPPDSEGSFEGAFLAYAFMHSYVKRSKAESLSVKEHLGEWQKLLDTSKDNFAAQKTEIGDLLQKYSQDFEEQKENSLQLREDGQKELDELFNRSKTELVNIENTYDKKLALQSSVKYWEDKGEQHKRLSIIFACMSVIVAVIVSVLFFVEIKNVVGVEQKILDLPVWKVSLVILTAVIGVWVLRILVRILLSHVHLTADATERRTMLMTYLALLREGHGPVDDQKELILQTLFRPSSTGIVKDDGMPSVMAKWINTVTN